MNSLYELLLLLTMTFAGSLAALSLKLAGALRGLREVASSKFLYAGGFLYLCSAVLNIRLLQSMEYSIVLPLTSLTYVWTLGLSSVFLSERLSFRKFFGILLIVAGAAAFAW